MGSYVNVINTTAEFETGKCIFLNTCTVILRLKKKKNKKNKVSPHVILSPISSKAVPFDTGQYSNSARFFFVSKVHIFQSVVCKGCR